MNLVYSWHRSCGRRCRNPRRLGEALEEQVTPVNVNAFGCHGIVEPHPFRSAEITSIFPSSRPARIAMRRQIQVASASLHSFSGLCSIDHQSRSVRISNRQLPFVRIVRQGFGLSDEVFPAPAYSMLATEACVSLVKHPGSPRSIRASQRIPRRKPENAIETQAAQRNLSRSL